MHARRVLNNHLLVVWLCLLRSSILHYFLFSFFAFLSAEKCDKGGGLFPQVCPLCWLNDDVTQYEMPCTGTHMGVVHPLKGKGGSYPLRVVPPFG